jgi:TRAP transporter TAXI family solute receptor
MGLFFIIVFYMLGGAAQTVAEDKIQAPQMAFTLGSPTGGWMAIGSTIADEVNKRCFEGYPLTAIPGAGGVGNPKRVGIGKQSIKFGFSYAPFLRLAVAGKPPYDKAYTNLKGICSLTRNGLQFVFSKDLNMKSLKEIKEKKIPLRIGVGPTGSGDLFVVETVLGEIGVTLDDIKGWGGKVEYVFGANRVNLWKDRHINASGWQATLPSPLVADAMLSRQGDFVQLEESFRDLLKEKWGFEDFAIPSGTYKGQDYDVHSVGLSINVFVRDDVSEEIVYRFTKTIAEMKETLVQGHPGFKKWEPEGMTTVGIDYHPGALKYYKERGWK